MESDDLVATYTFQCSVTHRIYHVTVRGQFYVAVREAEELVAQKMLEFAKREEPENDVTIESCRSRLHGIHYAIELGNVHVLDIDRRAQPRSMVLR